MDKKPRVKPYFLKTPDLSVITMAFRWSWIPRFPKGNATCFKASSLAWKRFCMKGWQGLSDFECLKASWTWSAKSTCWSILRSLKLNTNSVYSKIDLILSTLQQVMSARNAPPASGCFKLRQTSPASALVWCLPKSWQWKCAGSKPCTCKMCQRIAKGKKEADVAMAFWSKVWTKINTSIIHQYQPWICVSIPESVSLGLISATKTWEEKWRKCDNIW